MIGRLDVLAVAVAECLDGFADNAYTKHRGLLVQIFAFAVAKGMAERNVAEMTLVKKEAEKQRQHHTREGLAAIIDHPATPEWLNRAIRISLATLLRREDVVTLRKDVVDMAKGNIRVSPGKSEKYANPIHLEIQMGAALREAVQECLRSPIVSPFLIHYRPKARKREQLDAKEHWTAVTPDYLTKEFSRVRDLSGAYDHIPVGQRPTFHEVRALGSWLYDQQQLPEEYTQTLMGHADPKMTRYYQEGHGEQVGEYQIVGADLKI